MDITSASAVAAAAGVLVGVVFAMLELRNLVEARQTDLIIRLYTTFGARRFQEDLQKVLDTEYEDYNDFVRKYGLWAPEAGLFFEGVGVLLERNLIGIDLIDDLFTGPIKMFWGKAKPIIEDARERLDYPEYGEYIEYLYNELHKREQKLQQTQ